MNAHFNYHSLLKWLTLKCLPIFISCLLSILLATTASAQQQFPEPAIKAAYIYNFLRFVEWPQDTQQDAVICVVNQKTSYKPAFEALKNQKLAKRDIDVRYFKSNEPMGDFSGCHVLFITDNAENSGAVLLKLVKGQEILTVGETADFIEQGGMIYLVNRQNKVRFDVSVKAVKQSTLRITSRILRLADNVIN